MRIAAGLPVDAMAIIYRQETLLVGLDFRIQLGHNSPASRSSPSAERSVNAMHIVVGDSAAGRSSGVQDVRGSLTCRAWLIWRAVPCGFLELVPRLLTTTCSRWASTR